MTEYYDELETRDPEQRRAEQFTALAEQVAFAKSNAPAYAELFKGVDPAEVNTPEALTALPVIRKSELIERQKAARPFGGLAAGPAGSMMRVFFSPGPICEPEGRDPDYWRKWYKPGLKTMVQICHEAGLPVIDHGCGNVKKLTNPRRRGLGDTGRDEVAHCSSFIQVRRWNCRRRTTLCFAR